MHFTQCFEYIYSTLKKQSKVHSPRTTVHSPQSTVYGVSWKGGGLGLGLGLGPWNDLTGLAVSRQSQGMYKIIGADGKEYGPITVEVLRQWIAEGRADARTRVLAEGTTEWTTLAEVPEVSGLLAAAPTPVLPGTAMAGVEGPGPMRWP